MPFFAEKLFYGFSAVLLGAGIFVMQPAHNPELSSFQSNIKTQFAISASEVFDFRPMVGSVEFIVNGVNQFYQEAAESMISLLTPSPSMDGVNYLASATYNRFALLFSQNSPRVAGVSTTASETDPAPLAVPPNFMQEPPIYNIVPQNVATQAAISTANVIPSAEASQNTTWSNIEDTTTGQVYCVAIFNSEVNRYLGPCKNDYH